ncbi:hypothetical protein [Pseudobacteriovorax antillogorgiicola]|uniref:hypothetical protein n=1 Tax=Pseudobacteriovorax antillogorgiicola TaxID=1513793 RepID=UPI0010469ADF|nr:hypothetical protein [Pseudobacteriovorax antillogorgiicola]
MEDGYQPWMASPILALEVLKGNMKPLESCQERFSTDRRFLNSYSKFFVTDFGKTVLPFSYNIKINEQIESNGKQSISIFEKGISQIDFWPEWMKILFENLIVNIVPICSHQGVECGNSFTDHNFIGTIFTSVEYDNPYPDLLLNISLAHELAHNLLMIYNTGHALFTDPSQTAYSGIREVQRPVVAAMHSAVALMYMSIAAFSLARGEVGARRAFLETLQNEYRNKLKINIEGLLRTSRTKFCDEILREMVLVA